MIDGPTLRHFDAQAAVEQRSGLIALYEGVWLSDWKRNDPFFSRQRFVDRLDKHLAAPGFELVTARVGARLVGYIYGFSRIREEKFIVCELMVAAEYRRRGLGRRLHDALLGGRSEQAAELLVEKENVPAQAAYRHWGWHKAGDLQPFTDAPNYDVMVIDLPITPEPS
jgi:ribosomal protein S18 acetylase RimI-like enzyme